MSIMGNAGELQKEEQTAGNHAKQQRNIKKGIEKQTKNGLCKAQSVS